MVDHIDRNTLNNCLSNLRECNHKINNNNRSKSISCNNNLPLGIKLYNNCYIARIKQNEKEFSKSFSINEYGEELAYKLACEKRKEFNIAFNCNNG